MTATLPGRLVDEINQTQTVVRQPDQDRTDHLELQAAVGRVEELGAIVLGRKIGTHPLRHRYARHLLMNGIQINFLAAVDGVLLSPGDARLPEASPGPVGES